MNGKSKEVVIYIHGQGGNAAEAEHYKPLFKDSDVTGFDYKASTPWEAKAEFSGYMAQIRRKYDRVTVIANSIGAFFCMTAWQDEKIEKAYFISPVVDMEKLIESMMLWAGVGEDELRERGTIETSFGQTLSWEYLSYVRKNPTVWSTPTHIIRGEKDELVSFDTVSDFAARTKATLSVMEGAEHWFHTKEQLDFIDGKISADEKSRYAF